MQVASDSRSPSPLCQQAVEELPSLGGEPTGSSPSHAVEELPSLGGEPTGSRPSHAVEELPQSRR